MREKLRIFWLRVRVSFARDLLKGTGCEVARTQPIEAAAAEIWLLRNYVMRSGGLNQPAIPRRLRAYRKVLAATETLHANIRQISLPTMQQ